MSARFEGLRERLLKGGIAPRHVRRYLRELSEHLADLTEARRDAGHDPETAAMSARAALGPDADLADAMLKQRDFRSISARFPWLVFGLMPPVGVILGFVLAALLVVLVGIAGGALPTPRPGAITTPDWYRATGTNMLLAATFIIGPLLAFGIALIAQRQRLSLAWPILAIILILVLGPRAHFNITPNSVGIGLSSIFPLVPRAFGGPTAMHWPTFLGQTVLLCLPLAWLLRRRALAKVPSPS